MIDRIENPPVGMLRRGSPVVFWRPSERCLIEHRGITSGSGAGWQDVSEDAPACWWVDREGVDPKWIALDLTDPTGRAHLAAWLLGRHLISGGAQLPAEIVAMQLALRFHEMPPAQIDLLARLALRAMGRL